MVVIYIIIVKKDDSKEIFLEDKLARSIKNSSRDVCISLNNSDVKMLCREIINKLNLLNKEEKITNSYEVMAVTISVLKENKFEIIIPSYLGLK